MQEFELKNKIKAVYRQNKNTPRVGLSFNFSINEAESLPGIYCLMSRLLLQGTKTRTSEQLANELEENAIELHVDMKQDYLRFRFICLNEDFDLATEIMSDIIKNSTFVEFEKEKTKMQGEITAELDSAKVKALDNYYKTLFEGHFYGHTYTKMLENLNKITKQDVIDAYKNIVSTSKKVLSFVGDLDFEGVNDLTNASNSHPLVEGVNDLTNVSNSRPSVEGVNDLLNKYLSDIENCTQCKSNIFPPELKESKTVEIIKQDAQQAQIIQGWIMPTFDNKDYPALVLLNVILGSAGLSSRLFLELREKKGLAYHVRSNYETNEKCANFSIYIATEPKNIQICLDGFKAEIDKLKEIPISNIELENAKNNLIGKQQFMTETNFQQANQLAYYGIMGLGFDFQDTIIEKIREVKPEQIQDCANKYFLSSSVISILRPNF